MTERDAQSPAAETVEIPKTEPTSVLEYLIVQRPDLSQTVGTYIDYRNHMDKAQLAVGRYYDGIDEKIHRLESSVESTRARLTQIRSSMTIDAAYLKIADEFKEQFTPTQIRDIFLQALKLNDELSADKIASIDHEENKKRVFLRQSHWKKLDADGKRRFMEQKGVIAPAWYKGTKADWYTLVINHGHFAVITNKERILRTVQTPVGLYNIYDEEADLGNTVKGGVPDWFSDFDIELPTRDQVEDEYKEDEEEKAVYVDLLAKSSLQAARLRKVVNQKFYRTMVFVENDRRQLEAGSDDIFKALLYLDVNKTTNEYPDYDDFDNLSAGEFDKSVILSEQATKRATEGFADRLHKTPEVVALWVEDVLSDGKVPVETPAIRNIFEFIAQSPTQEALFELKSKDKKLHNVLKYKLLPLFSLMSSEEIQYLRELASAVDSPFELIAEFGQLASLQLNVLQDGAEPSPLTKELRLFTSKFLSQNKENFAGRALRILSSVHNVERNPASEELDAKIISVTEEAAEIEDELMRTNIANWSVQLSDGYHLKTGREHVEGTTLEEYEESVDSLFQKTGRAFSIKTSSIVRTLDWFLGVPEEFLRIWPKEEVDGVEYYKVKRGAVRLFCHLNREQQEMTFFPYQKDDMAYHFRS